MRIALVSGFGLALAIAARAAAQEGLRTEEDTSQHGEQPAPAETADPATGKPVEDAATRERFAALRKVMVDSHLRGRDITDTTVLAAMARVPRHLFVPPEYRAFAYADRPLPIGHGQTISQPYIVALMTQCARVGPGKRALDVGTGSGYQAAVLAEVCRSVYSIEIVEPLAETARQRLSSLGYENVMVRAGDGYRGWPKYAPFDVIIVAAAAPRIPEPLIAQLAPGGRLVMPLGALQQELIVIEKRRDGSLRRRSVAPVAFVPMTGEVARPRQPQ